jgi:hypothetical protein
MKRYARYEYDSLMLFHHDKNFLQFSSHSFQYKIQNIPQDTSLDFYLNFCRTLGMYNLCVAENKENPDFVDPVEKLKKGLLELLGEEKDDPKAIRWLITFFIYTIQ